MRHKRHSSSPGHKSIAPAHSHSNAMSLTSPNPPVGLFASRIITLEVHMETGLACTTLCNLNSLATTSQARTCHPCTQPHLAIATSVDSMRAKVSIAPNLVLIAPRFVAVPISLSGSPQFHCRFRLTRRLTLCSVDSCTRRHLRRCSNGSVWTLHQTSIEAPGHHLNRQAFQSAGFLSLQM